MPIGAAPLSIMMYFLPIYHPSFPSFFQTGLLRTVTRVWPHPRRLLALNAFFLHGSFPPVAGLHKSSLRSILLFKLLPFYNSPTCSITHSFHLILLGSSRLCSIGITESQSSHNLNPLRPSACVHSPTSYSLQAWYDLRWPR